MKIINALFSTVTVDLKRKTFYLDLLFLFVCVWTLIASGSEAQYYLFKFINSDSSTLYGSVFEDAIARIPTFNEYVKGAYSFSGSYGFLAALIIVVVALFYQTTVQIFIVSIISSAFGLTVTDFLMFAFNGTLTTQAMIECVMANALGSPIIASFIVLLFYIKKFLFNVSSINLALRYISNYVVYSIICFLILFVTYYIVCFFYRPTAVNFSVSTSEEFSGDYFLSDKNDVLKEAKGSLLKDRFSLLNSPVKLNGTINVFGEIDSILSKFNASDVYTVRVLPLLNCIDGGAINAALADYLSYEGVRGFSIKSSESMTLITFGDKAGYVKSNDELVNMFTVKKNNKSGFDITKVNDGVFSYYPSESSGSMYVATGVTDFKGDQSKKEVKYTLDVNGVKKIFHVDVSRLRAKNAERKLQCQIASFTSSSNDVYIDAGEAVYVGVLIKLILNQKNEYFSLFSERDNKFDVKGKLLYVQAKNVSRENVVGHYVTKGYLNGFILHSFDKLSIDGKNVESNKMDNLMVMGEGIYGHVSADNNLVISGKADLFYKNRLRQNKTLWETSSDNTLILGGIGALMVSLLLWCVNRIYSSLKKNEVINSF